MEAPTNPDIIFHRTPDSSTFPGPPQQPRVLNLTETSIALGWQADTNTGASPVLAYTLEYFSHDLGKGFGRVFLVECKMDRLSAGDESYN